jgi:glutathione S-transferase
MEPTLVITLQPDGRPIIGACDPWSGLDESTLAATLDGQPTSLVNIDEKYGDRRPSNLLAPAGTLERYRTLEWLNFISSELHKGFTPLFRPTTPPEYRQIARQNLLNRLQWLDEQLAGRDFLIGSAFTVADAYCYTIVMWTRLHDIDLSPWPHLKAYLARIAARTSVMAAEQAERRVKAAA